MRMNTGTPQTYARAFQARGRMVAFHADLEEQAGWMLASRILFRRFELAFGAFLDAPTPDRLARIVVFEAEIAEVAERLPNLAQWRREAP